MLKLISQNWRRTRGWERLGKGRSKEKRVQFAIGHRFRSEARIIYSSEWQVASSTARILNAEMHFAYACTSIEFIAIMGNVADGWCRLALRPWWTLTIQSNVYCWKTFLCLSSIRSNRSFRSASELVDAIFKRRKIDRPRRINEFIQPFSPH